MISRTNSTMTFLKKFEIVTQNNRLTPLEKIQDGD